MQYSKLKTLLIYNILEKYSDEEHPLSTTDLISMLEEKGVKCERKSIYADIAALNDIGCDIITVTSPKRGFFMASRTFEIPEVMLLIDAVSSAGFITPKKTESLIEKLETLVSVEQAKTMKSQVYVDTSCAKCDNEEIYIIIDRLNNAIADEKKVKFVYRRRSVDVQNRKKHTEKTFTVSPYALIWKDDHYYLVCNNQKYDNLMNLRIDRMKKLEILDEPSRHFSEVSPYKDKFDEHDYVSKRFNMFSGDECNVTLKCNIQLQEEMLDRFGKNIPLTAVDGNHFETTVTATVSDGFISWLMQYGDGVEVTGFVSSPALSRGNRSMQYFYCNGRFIKSALLQSAVEQAYRNTLTGRYPACTLFITLKTSAVDVNVHPAKTEVRFSDEKNVFDTVYQTVKAALEAEAEPLELKISESTQRMVSTPRTDFFRSMPAREYRTEYTRPAAASTPRREPSYAAPRPTARPSVNEPLTTTGFTAQSTGFSTENVEKTVESVEKITALNHRVIGECLNTYILVEIGDELLLIDKHAAHERMIFDRLKAQGRQIMSQTLLTPVIIKPTGEDGELLEQNEALLSDLGFEIEPYGAGAYAIRALPDDMDVSDAKAAVEEICEKLRRGDIVSADSASDELLHTVACKAAIKAGRRHDIRELERIADAVIAGEVRYFPHGRPVSVRLTKNELDKFFSRIV